MLMNVFLWKMNNFIRPCWYNQAQNPLTHCSAFWKPNQLPEADIEEIKDKVFLENIIVLALSK